MLILGKRRGALQDLNANRETKRAYAQDRGKKARQNKMVKIFKWQVAGYEFFAHIKDWSAWYMKSTKVTQLVEKKPTADEIKTVRENFEDYTWAKHCRDVEKYNKKCKFKFIITFNVSF